MGMGVREDSSSNRGQQQQLHRHHGERYLRAAGRQQEAVAE